jgi:hypothetical protein
MRKVWLNISLELFIQSFFSEKIVYPDVAPQGDGKCQSKPPPGDVAVTALAIGGLLCGNSPFAIRDSGMPHLDFIFFPTHSFVSHLWNWDQ